MARQGLPKKYAKMGFAKGWKAYKASKKKRKTRKVGTRRKVTASKRSPTKTKTVRVYKKRATAQRRSPTMARRRRRKTTTTRRRRRTVTTQRSVRILTNAALGVAGAGGAAMVVNSIPGLQNNPMAKAATAGGIGLGIILMVPKRRNTEMIRWAGFGALLTGVLALTRSQLANWPTLAGNYNAAMPYNNSANGQPQSMGELELGRPAYLGTNAIFAGNGNSGSSQFLTSANW